MNPSFKTRNGFSIPVPCLFLYLKEDGQVHCSTHVQVAANRFTYVTCSLDPEELAAFWQLFLKDPASCLEVYFKHACIYEEGPAKPKPAWSAKPVAPKAPAPAKLSFSLQELGLLKTTR